MAVSVMLGRGLNGPLCFLSLLVFLIQVSAVLCDCPPNYIVSPEDIEELKNGFELLPNTDATWSWQGTATDVGDFDGDSVSDFALVQKNSANQISLQIISGTMVNESGSIQLEAGISTQAHVYTISGLVSPNDVSITGGGDINGDNLADVCIGEINGLTLVQCVFGRPNVMGTTQSLPVPFAAPFGVKFGCGTDADGFSLDTGDFNSDGIDDLLIGLWGVAGGFAETYVWYGRTAYPSATYLLPDDLAPDKGVKIELVGGNFEASSFAAPSFSKFIGDMNNDNITDIGISVPLDKEGASSTGPGVGSLVIVFGNYTSPNVLTPNKDRFALISAIPDIAIPDKMFAFDFAGLGDVNGDGYDDLGVIQVASDVNGIGKVIYGPLTNGMAYNSTDYAVEKDTLGCCEPTQDVWLASPTVILSSISPAGDMNNDGLDDYMIGSKSALGSLYVLYGYTIHGYPGPPVGGETASLNPYTFLFGDRGFAITHVTDGVQVVASSMIGDVNGDAIADIVFVDDSSNSAYVYYSCPGCVQYVRSGSGSLADGMFKTLPFALNALGTLKPPDRYRECTILIDVALVQLIDWDTAGTAYIIVNPLTIDTYIGGSGPALVERPIIKMTESSKTLFYFQPWLKFFEDTPFNINIRNIIISAEGVVWAVTGTSVPRVIGVLGRHTLLGSAPDKEWIVNGTLTIENVDITGVWYEDITTSSNEQVGIVYVRYLENTVLINCTIEDNQVQGDTMMGIVAVTGNSLVVNGCHFTNNMVNRTNEELGGISGDEDIYGGGAVSFFPHYDTSNQNNPQLNITNSEFSHCRSNVGGAAVFADRATVHIYNCDISESGFDERDQDSIGTTIAGGAVSLRGLSPEPEGRGHSIIGSEFAGNYVWADADVAGGAVAYYTDTARGPAADEDDTPAMTIRGTLFIFNRIFGGNYSSIPDSWNTKRYLGGAIFVGPLFSADEECNSCMSISLDEVECKQNLAGLGGSYNHAQGGCLAAVKVRNCDVSGGSYQHNQAGKEGGAMYVTGMEQIGGKAIGAKPATFELQGPTTFSDNKAGDGTPHRDREVYGGALQLVTLTADIRDGNFVQNLASSVNSEIDAKGGAINLEGGVVAYISDSFFRHNEASPYNISQAAGGAIHMGSLRGATAGNQNHLELDNVIMTDNKANRGSAVAVSAVPGGVNTGAGVNAGIDKYRLVANRCTFSHNLVGLPYGITHKVGGTISSQINLDLFNSTVKQNERLGGTTLGGSSGVIVYYHNVSTAKLGGIGIPLLAKEILGLEEIRIDGSELTDHQAVNGANLRIELADYVAPPEKVVKGNLTIGGVPGTVPPSTVPGGGIPITVPPSGVPPSGVPGTAPSSLNPIPAPAIPAPGSGIPSGTPATPIGPIGPIGPVTKLSGAGTVPVSVQITNSAFSKGTADHGAGMYLNGYANINITRSTFSQNRAFVQGGAIATRVSGPSFLRALSSTFDDNAALSEDASSGEGAVWHARRTHNATFEYCTMTKNKAATSKSAIFSGMCDVVLSKSLVLIGDLPLEAGSSTQVTDGGYNVIDLADPLDVFSDGFLYPRTSKIQLNAGSKLSPLFAITPNRPPVRQLKLGNRAINIAPAQSNVVGELGNTRDFQGMADAGAVEYTLVIATYTPVPSSTPSPSPSLSPTSSASNTHTPLPSPPLPSASPSPSPIPSPSPSPSTAPATSATPSSSPAMLPSPSSTPNRTPGPPPSLPSATPLQTPSIDNVDFDCTPRQAAPGETVTCTFVPSLSLRRLARKMSRQARRGLQGAAATIVYNIMYEDLSDNTQTWIAESFTPTIVHDLTFAAGSYRVYGAFSRNDDGSKYVTLDRDVEIVIAFPGSTSCQDVVEAAQVLIDQGNTEAALLLLASDPLLLALSADDAFECTASILDLLNSPDLPPDDTLPIVIATGIQVINPTTGATRDLTDEELADALVDILETIQDALNNTDTVSDETLQTVVGFLGIMDEWYADNEDARTDEVGEAFLDTIDSVKVASLRTLSCDEARELISGAVSINTSKTTETMYSTNDGSIFQIGDKEFKQLTGSEKCLATSQSQLDNFIVSCSKDCPFCEERASRVSSLTFHADDGVALDFKSATNGEGLVRMVLALDPDVSSKMTETVTTYSSCGSKKSTTKRVKRGKPDCSYFDPKTKCWSKKGCKRVSYSDTELVCECDHLTDFSAVLGGDGGGGGGDGGGNCSSDAYEMDYIAIMSIVAIGVACICTVLIIVFFLYVRKFRKIILGREGERIQGVNKHRKVEARRSTYMSGRTENLARIPQTKRSRMASQNHGNASNLASTFKSYDHELLPSEESELMGFDEMA